MANESTYFVRSPNGKQIIGSGGKCVILKKPDTNYLTFTATNNATNIKFSIVGGVPVENKLSYSLDNGETWSEYKWGTTIALAKNNSCKWKGSTNTLSVSSKLYVYFNSTDWVSASGNIMSLLNFSSSCPAYCFYSLFGYLGGLGNLLTPPELPATNLSAYCYAYMFRSNTRLSRVPDLPAKIAADHCYAHMFSGCSTLTTAKISITTMSPGMASFYRMFYDCTALTEISLKDFYGSFNSDFNNWAYNVSRSGKLYYNGPDSTTGASGIPSGWTAVIQSSDHSAERSSTTLTIYNTEYTQNDTEVTIY